MLALFGLDASGSLVTDAGQFVPGYSIFGPERVQFFIHSPFGWRTGSIGAESGLGHQR